MKHVKLLLIYMGFANAGPTLVGRGTGTRDPRQLLSLFTDNSDILTISVPYLRFVSWILFPKAINNVIGLCIRGMGDIKWMLYTQSFGSIFMIAAGYLLILHTGMGLPGIFVTLLADETLRGITNLIRLCSQSQKLLQRV